MAELKADPFPDVVRIEPVGLCNFKCIHCPTGIEPNQRRLLREESFSVILKQFLNKEFIPRVVVLYHGGEPLLNKYVSNYIRTLKQIGVSKVHIVTNGSLLTKQLSEKLITAGLDEVHISFDGENANENNSIRKGSDFYRDAGNVKELYRIYKDLGLKPMRIVISNVQILNNVDSLPETTSGQLGVPSYLTEYFNDECPDIEFQSFPAMVWPGFNVRGEFEIEAKPELKPTYCKSLFETITIMANGDVVPCCYDLTGEAVFGNVFSDNLFDIWENTKYREFRENFKSQMYSGPCTKCKFVAPQFLLKKLSSKGAQLEVSLPG